MATITQYAPETGRLIGEDGQIYNIVDLLGPSTPVGGGVVANVNDYTPKTGRVIGEDGQIYNLVDLFQSLSSSGGDMTKAVYDTNNNNVVDSAESAPWAGITDKPTTFPPSAHTHAIADVTNLQTTLNSKLTATQAAAQADSDGTDLTTDFNALLAKLRAAGILAT